MGRGGRGKGQREGRGGREGVKERGRERGGKEGCRVGGVSVVGLALCSLLQSCYDNVLCAVEGWRVVTTSSHWCHPPHHPAWKQKYIASTEIRMWRVSELWTHGAERSRICWACL